MLGARARYFRGLHAEAEKRGLDHDGLRQVCRERFGVESMAELGEEQLGDLYRAWTGKGLRRRTGLPRESARAGVDAQMVSGEDLRTLGSVFAALEWGKETQRNFVARQLGGRVEIRTTRDFFRVFHGARAMARRRQA